MTERGWPHRGDDHVHPSLETLPLMFLPRRLRHRFPKAAGSNSLRVWRMGAGIWASGELTPDLRVELDPSKPDLHGLVGPNATMPIDHYRAALASTQDSWSVVQEPPAS